MQWGQKTTNPWIIFAPVHSRLWNSPHVIKSKETSATGDTFLLKSNVNWLKSKNISLSLQTYISDELFYYFSDSFWSEMNYSPRPVLCCCCCCLYRQTVQSEAALYLQDKRTTRICYSNYYFNGPETVSSSFYLIRSLIKLFPSCSRRSVGLSVSIIIINLLTSLRLFSDSLRLEHFILYSQKQYKL